jgi:hypothetical protein
MHHTVCCCFLISSGWGGGEGRESEGEKRGGLVGGGDKRVGGVRGYFITLERLVGVGEQCSKVTLQHCSPPPPAMDNVCVCTHSYAGMHM